MISQPVEIAYPFSIDNNGGISQTQDISKIVANHISAIIGTRFSTRVMRANYGSHLADAVFDSNDDREVSFLIQDVKDAIAKWEPNIIIVNVIPAQKQGFDPESTLALTVLFKVRLSSGQISSVNSALVRVGGTVIETRSNG